MFMINISVYPRNFLLQEVLTEKWEKAATEDLIQARWKTTVYKFKVD